MRVKLIDSAMRQMLNSPAMLSELQSRARRIASAAGEGFEADPAQKGRKRGRVVVAPKTFEARKREARDGVLMRAIDAGR
jgi:hypothetical protein